MLTSRQIRRQKERSAKKKEEAPDMKVKRLALAINALGQALIEKGTITQEDWNNKYIELIKKSQGVKNVTD